MHTIHIDNAAVRLEVRCSTMPTETDTALVFIPGLTEAGTHYAEMLAGEFHLSMVFPSLRGRGGSIADGADFSFAQHVCDIEAVIDGIGAASCVLIAHSAGVAYALGYLEKCGSSRVRALILGDYPPVYPPLEDSWLQRVLAKPIGDMQPAALEALARDSELVVLADTVAALDIPILVLQAGIDPLLSNDNAAVYQQVNAGCELRTLEKSDHSLFAPDKEQYVAAIRDFLVRNAVM